MPSQYVRTPVGVGLEITWQIFTTIFEVGFSHPFSLLRLYGTSGLFLFLFGNHVVWRVEVQVLGQLHNDDAMVFKKSVLDECTMISVAAAIVAQIAITALSLNSLSQTHWTARGFLIFSLTTALMAVYYATTQQRAMGRLLHPKQVRSWIRGGFDANEAATLDLMLKLPHARLDGNCTERAAACIHRHIQEQLSLFPCDPQDLDQLPGSLADHPNYLRKKCFTPSVASVITISAPQMLLSTSLVSLLAAIGIYLGFTWTKNLDKLAGPHDSRHVFIMYVVGLGVCILVYSISRIIQERDGLSEMDIFNSYMRYYVESHSDVVAKWGVVAQFDKVRNLRFIPAADRNHSPATELGILSTLNPNGNHASVGVDT